MTARHLAALALALAGCTRPAESRALAELDVGSDAISDANVSVAGGLAAIRALTDARLELWAGAPAIDVELVLGPNAAPAWTIVARNTLPDAVLVTNGTTYPRAPGDPPTVATFTVPLAAGTHVLRIAPPDADRAEPFRIAAMADIQTALPDVDDVFRAISAVPDARFVVSMGDLTERSEVAEYEHLEAQLAHLTIPFYTTLGNHELWGPHERYFDRFGRASFQFVFKGVAFTFADSGDGGIDPIVDGWLDDWLAGARDRTHVFLTHMPPVDPVGTRYGSFRSSREGHRLLSKLVAGGVDLTLYGHIHTFIEYDNGGIPAYISGGGGAAPMRWDGIDRHFLLVDFDAGGVGPVDVRSVD